jgi:ribonuclease VapC
VVLDASALIAVLRDEPGATAVQALLGDSLISAVNFAEVLKKTVEHGGSSEMAASFVRSLEVTIVPFDESQAALTANLYPRTKEHGMSFADRACLALGVHRGATILTTERKMGKLNLSVKVKVIR